MDSDTDCYIQNICEEDSNFMPDSIFSLNNSNDCCHDTNQFIQGSSTTIQDGIHLTQLQNIFLSAFTLSYLKISLKEVKTSNQFKNYVPPLILKEITILFQVFII